MAAHVEPRVLDLGLNVLDVEATHIYICSSEPTTFTEATSTLALGSKNFGAGGCFGAPANGGSANTRKVTSNAITDGSVTATGNAAFWAVVDQTNSRFLAVGQIAAPQSVTSGNTFTLAPFDVQLSGQ